MKKKFIVIVAMSFCLLTGCGSSSVAVSDKASSCAQSASDTITSYLNKETTYDEALNALKELSDDMNYVNDESTDVDTHTGDLSVLVDIDSAKTHLMSDNIKGNSETYSALEEDASHLLTNVDK